jgi:hypothetical protein
MIDRALYLARNWSVHAAAAVVRLKALAPYALIELILPGGSVMALLLWLYRQRKSGVGFGQSSVRLLSFLRLADPLRGNAAVRSAVDPAGNSVSPCSSVGLFDLESSLLNQSAVKY